MGDSKTLNTLNKIDFIIENEGCEGADAFGALTEFLKFCSYADPEAHNSILDVVSDIVDEFYCDIVESLEDEAEADECHKVIDEQPFKDGSTVRCIRDSVNMCVNGSEEDLCMCISGEEYTVEFMVWTSRSGWLIATQAPVDFLSNELHKACDFVLV